MKHFNSVCFAVALVGAFVLSGCGGGGGDAPSATYSVSGTVLCAAGNAVDSDINDTAVENRPNNTFDTAQPLTSPAVLGGYVNQPGAGSDGQTFEPGDRNDFFIVSLSVGEVVRLVLPDDTDISVNRIYLRLYDGDRSQAAAQTFATPAIAVSAATAGIFYVEVGASSGASAYRLMIGAPAALMPSAAVNSPGEFVPGEVLVRLADGTASQADDTGRMAAFAGRIGMRMIASAGAGWMRLQITDMPATLQRLNLPAGRRLRRRAALFAPAADRQNTWRVVQALRKRSDVVHAQPNFIRRALRTPNDPLFPYQWNLALIHLPEAWELSTGDRSVIVAVIDTGILSDHPDLQNKLVDGYDFISAPANDGDADPGPDADPTDPGGDAGSGDFHGTHVAGIIGAEFGNDIGVAGVGGAVRIMPVRVLGRNGGTDADIARAVRWAAGLPTQNEDGSMLPGADPPADIINMSLGGEGVVDPNTDILRQAVGAARAAGVIVIAAAGNHSGSAPDYPAAYPEVVSVSAVNADGARALYSNYGPTIDLAAPGGDLVSDLQPDGYADGILSTVGIQTMDGGTLDYSYIYYQGTSFAAPHAAGMAALMKAVQPEMGPDDFDNYIKNGAIAADLGPPGKDDFYGYGLIDAQQALTAASAGPAPAAASVMPAAVRMDGYQSSARLFLRQVGSGPLTLTDAVSDEAWLTITPTQTEDGFGQYAVGVTRDGLTGGVHTGIVSFLVPDRTLAVPVTIDVLPDPAASASTQYISLIDAQTSTLTYQAAASASGGVYRFGFTGVKPGSYYLVSGSDLDGDYLIQDQGEAVGAYPSMAGQAILTVKGDRTGLNFVVSFQYNSFLLPMSPPTAAKGAAW